MGFHICQFCKNATSSGDVHMAFTNGHKYIMPDMIKHYVEVHMFLPPAPFIEDILHGTLAPAPRSVAGHERVGYLENNFSIGQTTPAFRLRLRQLMEQATAQGDRWQTRGM